VYKLKWGKNKHWVNKKSRLQMHKSDDQELLYFIYNFLFKAIYQFLILGIWDSHQKNHIKRVKFKHKKDDAS